MRAAPGAFVLLLLLAAPCLAASTPNAAQPDTLLAEVLDLAGIRRMIEQIPAQVKASAERDQSRVPAPLRAKLAAAMQECYASDALMRTVTDTIARDATRDQLAAALEMLRSPLSLRFTELEVRAGTPEARKLMESWATRLRYSPLSEERIALVEKIDDETGASGLVVEIAVATAGSIARSVASATAPLTAAERAKLDDAIVKLHEQLLPAMREQMQLLLAFTYRDVNDRELTRYLEMCASPPGRWLSRASAAGLRAALGRAAAELGRKLAAAK